MTLRFAENPFAPARRRTREVRVGKVGIGGTNPIRIQSMTNTDTCDAVATAAQVEALARAGCEIIRVTAPSVRDAENLGAIRGELDKRGVTVPLVADIHFTPNAAMIAAEHVEKVRINPGNYADKKRFEIREYSEDQYREELERVAERFRPLVLRCKELGRAMRIGTNHGSLSDRIMNRYGDTPLGMVESALEFLDVCEDEGFYDVVFSMKASNAQVTIHAYRLLAARLAERAAGEASYPMHLGVTEAGDGEEGRVKSAIGIGALLEDGIGDTIRVSLTEDPVKEVPVARRLARRYDERKVHGPSALDPGGAFASDPYRYARRSTAPVASAGGENPVRVEVDLGPVAEEVREAAREVELSLGRLGDLECEGLLVEVADAAEAVRAKTFANLLTAAGVGVPLAIRVPVALVPDVAGAAARVVVPIQSPLAADQLQEIGRVGCPVEWSFQLEGRSLLEALDQAVASGCEGRLVSVASGLPVHGARLLAARLEARSAGRVPIVLHHRADPSLDPETALLRAATDLGAPLCDGIGDLVSLGGFGALDHDVSLAYRILQGARLRTSWTEFISCPSCGRTLFDLEETTARVKERTSHLPGLKIAVMGCIVNGPGEMADADFGYVGSGPGKVNLYAGRECVVRGVREQEAPDRLVELIRQLGRWADPA
jgi:(E)-4-hydroxy-3-methylbut-2-enyl-diphosphate synthase